MLSLSSFSAVDRPPPSIILETSHNSRRRVKLPNYVKFPMLIAALALTQRSFRVDLNYYDHRDFHVLGNLSESYPLGHEIALLKNKPQYSEAEKVRRLQVQRLQGSIGNPRPFR